MPMGKKLDIVLAYAPPTVNHYWLQRGLRRFLTKRANAFRRDIKDHCKGHRLEGLLSVRIDYHPPDRRKRDIDNIIKPILDALQHAGLFEDDFQVKKITATRHDVISGGSCVITVAELID
jgi:crossover junction endodeoxyribonuclease RusA